MRQKQQQILVITVGGAVTLDRETVELSISIVVRKFTDFE